MKYQRLFTPITINKLELKNRVLMPAVHHMYTPEGKATPQFNEYYYRRAEGGVGLIIVGGCRFEDYGGTYGMMSLADDSYIPGYKAFTDGIHARGAKVGVQLFHAGRYAQPAANEDRTPLAPSAVYSGYSRATPKEMSKEEILTVQDQWVAAALRAKEAGFDLVEILASAGYLICQFLSPMTNLREDEYGGSWENRTRFARELVAKMRAAVGEDYPIAMRIAGNDLVPGSNNTEDAVRFARDMESAGIDLLNVTGGWHESTVPQITGDLPRGGFDHIAAAIGDAVTIPVACGNRVNDPLVAERILATGCAEMVSLGRPHIADPDWCNKAMTDEGERIRRCMACNQGCLANAFFNKPVECLVNGEAGREYLTKDLPQPAGAKKVLVVGGGPAGCEFALRAAQRGHDITLWEEAEKLGGQLALAALPPGKQEFFSLIRYYEASLSAQGVNVILGKKASAEEIKEGAFDAVIIAAGRGEAKEIPLDTDGSVPIYSAYDILKGNVVAGKDVLVIGGGSVGCETAQYLAREASASPEQIYHMLVNGYMPSERVMELLNTCRRNIAIVDVAKVGSGFQLGTGWPVLGELRRLGAKSYSFGTVRCIRDGIATLDVKDPKAAKDANAKNAATKAPATDVNRPDDAVLEVTVPVDTIVMSVGALPGEALFAALADSTNVYNIGDSAGIANIQSAIGAACTLIEELSAKGF